jgi:hypothetical protein
MSDVTASTDSLSSERSGGGEKGWELVQHNNHPDSRKDSSGRTVYLPSDTSSLGDGTTVSGFTVSGFTVIDDALSSHGGGSPAHSVSSSADDALPTTAQSNVKKNFAPLVKLFEHLKIFKESEGQGFERFQSLRVKFQQHTQQSQVKDANTYSIEIDDLGEQIVSMSSIGNRTSIYILTTVCFYDEKNQWPGSVVEKHAKRENTVIAMRDKPVEAILGKICFLSSDGRVEAQEDAGWFIKQLNKGDPDGEPPRYEIFGLIDHPVNIDDKKVEKPNGPVAHA